MSRSCQRATFSMDGEGVAAEDAREAGDALALLRVALVGHRAGAGLAFVEGLLGFEHFRLLQAADLGRELLQRRADDGQRRHELRVTVALEHLRRSLRRRGRAACRQSPRAPAGPRRACRPCR